VSLEKLVLSTTEQRVAHELEGGRYGLSVDVLGVDPDDIAVFELVSTTAAPKSGIDFRNRIRRRLLNFEAGSFVFVQFSCAVVNCATCQLDSVQYFVDRSVRFNELKYLLPGIIVSRKRMPTEFSTKSVADRRPYRMHGRGAGCIAVARH
jgi:hypothetical protein